MSPATARETTPAGTRTTPTAITGRPEAVYTSRPTTTVVTTPTTNPDDAPAINSTSASVSVIASCFSQRDSVVALLELDELALVLPFAVDFLNGLDSESVVQRHVLDQKSS